MPVTVSLTNARIMAVTLMRALVRLLLGLLALAAAPAGAATCGAATSAGTAPAGWETYCWLDMSTYNDATARSAGGQAMSFSLSDGSTFSFTVRTVSTAATGVNSATVPSWSGAAVGNSSFLGIPGRPVLYGANNASTVTLTFSNIQVTPPAGATAGSFMFIVADGESSNDSESLTYTTNGGNWTLLDQTPPISGNTYPTYVLNGQSATVTGVPGTVGAQIFGSVTPTTVSARLVNGGLQGVMFAVRFATVRLNVQLSNGRVAAADQFTYRIRSTSSGAALNSGTSTGAGNGPFTQTVSPLASGISITLDQIMAAGSSSIAMYSPRLTCTNATAGSPTPMPTNVSTSSFVLGSVGYGDAISCLFTNTRPPAQASLTLTKSSTVVSDPVNGTANPKAIPGAQVEYAITVTNIGTGAVDLSTVVLTDPLPTSLRAFVGGGAPVTFTNGTPSSGLTFAYATNVRWTSAPGGNSNFTYSPVADADGYDSAVTGLRIAPTGTMPAASAAGNPSFTIRLRGQVR